MINIEEIPDCKTPRQYVHAELNCASTGADGLESRQWEGSQATCNVRLAFPLFFLSFFLLFLSCFGFVLASRLVRHRHRRRVHRVYHCHRGRATGKLGNYQSPFSRDHLNETWRRFLLGQCVMFEQNRRRRCGSSLAPWASGNLDHLFKATMLSREEMTIYTYRSGGGKLGSLAAWSDLVWPGRWRLDWTLN